MRGIRMKSLKSIKKVLVANRGEIAIRIFRACTELDIRTVGIYSKEDSSSLHRFKADEAYLVGEGKKPIDAYLDIEDIIRIAKKHNVDAIHPGYGFLSENIDFATRLEEEGIILVGPKPKHLDVFGDKVKAKEQAIKAKIPVIPGTDGPVNSLEEAMAFGDTYGFPVMLKAALGGGGRGMRAVFSRDDLAEAYERSKSEAKAAFGNDEVYVEKMIQNPKHIEVQILGDEHGNIVHLWDRDCSIQRRHQKVVEIAPSMSLEKGLRAKICDAAVKVCESVGYVNAGTVEFLVSGDDFYFIEVNPRVQVEHTITELITGIDIVQTQLYIAMGYELHDKKVGIPLQEDIHTNGYAIQARVTTEDPLNNFMPDAGIISAYRSSGGFGVRLDAASGYAGAVVTPYYDSLLVKVCTWGLSFELAAKKMYRNLSEFRIRGLKTNIPFLMKVCEHKKFLSGAYDTTFIDTHPELFSFPKPKDRGTKMLNYIANVTVNGFPGIQKLNKPHFDKVRVPDLANPDAKVEGLKQVLDAQGPAGVVSFLKNQQRAMLTDTTFRDAHQSLLATRVRTKDLVQIAKETSQLLPNLFSMEMWGGATFDVAYRFLNEDPWERLRALRKLIPNHLFQMLLRGSNAVGYTNYPDNVVEEFVRQSAENGIDIFRIFDSLNYIENMRVAINSVRENNKIAEAAVCYTGDIGNPARDKYNLQYYVNMAKELEKAGAHILAIKDMAGLLKPNAAYTLVSALKDAVDLPIHLHSHDTSGNGVYMYTRAIEAGVDVVDVALTSMAGQTSQPSMNTLLYALEGHEKCPEIEIASAEKLSHYWEDVRKFYAPFESGMNAPHTEVYVHEMPGGQYSNLQQQAKGVGLGDRWEEVKDMYARVNLMFGDIVKVTPSSKVVGDMALFMVQNNLDEQSAIEKGMTLDFPASVIDMFQGNLGQPTGGWPEDLKKVILKDKEEIKVRPGQLLKPVDFDQMKEELEEKTKVDATENDVIAYTLYPKVFLDYTKKRDIFGDLSKLDTATFFYGMNLHEELEIEIEEGKTLIVKLLTITDADEKGYRSVYFEMNGQQRIALVKDESIKVVNVSRMKADVSNPEHIGATMPGTVLKVLSNVGATIKRGEHMMVTEAMKMETTVQAPFDCKVTQIHVKAGEQIEPGDLLIEIEKA